MIQKRNNMIWSAQELADVILMKKAGTPWSVIAKRKQRTSASVSTAYSAWKLHVIEGRDTDNHSQAFYKMCDEASRLVGISPKENSVVQNREEKRVVEVVSDMQVEEAVRNLVRVVLDSIEPKVRAVVEQVLREKLG